MSLEKEVEVGLHSSAKGNRAEGGVSAPRLSDHREEVEKSGELAIVRQRVCGGKNQWGKASLNLKKI